MKATENFRSRNQEQNKIEGALPFEINSLERLHERKEDSLRRVHSNKSFEIIWIVKGNGLHYIDLHKSKIDDNNLFFVRPGQVHQLQINEAAEGYVISFSESFLSIEDYEVNSTYHTSLFNVFVSPDAIAIDSDSLPDMKILPKEW